MAYVKTNWAAGVTPLSEANMDHLETQYDEICNLFDAHSLLIAIADNTPVVLTVAASRVVGRAAAGNIVALTGAQLWAILSGQAGAIIDFNAQVLDNIGAPINAGDALRKGTRIAITDLPTLTAGKYWLGVGGIPAEADPPVATAWGNGNYTGNNTANRAIPHGLGITPKLVLIYSTSYTSLHRIHGTNAWITYSRTTVTGHHAVTAADATNFYVGNAASYPYSANESGMDYYWIAVG